MQFRHPEILYALLLLLIPIIVHLFQLRKFKKEAFTNVAFLKQLELQTRKSNTLKKWLTLLMRMGAIAMAVIAFAQPFNTTSDTATKEKETLIYLDNSFSMQARGSSGPLMKQAVQELINDLPKDAKFSLFTNTDNFTDTSLDQIQNELIDLDYSYNQLDQTALKLRAQKQLSNRLDTDKRFVLISDFQGLQNTDYDFPEADVQMVQLRPESKENMAIDTAYIANRDANKLKLVVEVSAATLSENPVPVSLHNGQQLLAKASASFNEKTTDQVMFEIEPQVNLKGIITIEDAALSYDNSLYLAINTNKPIKVLSINEADASFLQRIFNGSEFDYTAIDASNLNYSQLENYNLVVVNGLSDPRQALGTALNSFAQNGGSVFVILNENTTLETTNDFLTPFTNIRVSELRGSKRLVTAINYDHPIYQGVFDKQTTNFQYPSVNASFNLTSTDALLSFEDGKPFIANSNTIYVSSNSYDLASTNFTNSPLIVPTLYNIARESLSIPELFFTIGETVNYDVSIAASGDEVIHLQNVEDLEDSSIPLQRNFAKKITITTDNQPSNAGNYDVKRKDSILQTVAYNFDRRESILNYPELQTTDTYTIHNSVKEVLSELREKNNIQSLWKWFVIFALFFLLMEMLILKFFK